MSKISLSTNSVFSRKISSERLQRLIESDRTEAAIAMGPWDRFKDLFYSNKKEKFLGDLHHFMHCIDTPNTPADIDAIKHIIQDASLTKVEDFFAWKDDSGQPLLHAMLSKGDACSITRYKKFLALLSEPQRHKHMVVLLAAIDQQGNSGLSIALENGHAEAITAYKSLLELLPNGTNGQDLFFLLSAQDRWGTPGLASALENGHSSAILAYQELLKLLPVPQRIRLLAAIDQDGQPGLLLALKNGHAEAITAYQSLFELIPASEYSRQLVNLVVAADKNDVPGIVWALENKHVNAIAAYRLLLTSIPQHATIDPLPALLLAIETVKPQTLLSSISNGDIAQLAQDQTFLSIIPESQRSTHLAQQLFAQDRDGNTRLHLASSHGRADVITNVGELLKSVPEPARSKQVMDLLTRKNNRGNSALSVACQCGYADAIAAYSILLECLSDKAREHYLFGLLAAKDHRGNPGFAWLLEDGQVESITAYQELLKLLQPSQLVGLLPAIDENGDPGLWLALKKGNAAAITAYGECLKLLPQAQRRTYLTALLTAKNKAGVSGLMIALKLGHTEAVDAFIALLELIPDDCRKEAFEQIFAAGSHNADQLFNHLESESNCSLLTCINNLDDNYLALKVHLMGQLAGTQSPAKITASQAASMMDIWSRNPRYLEHPAIWGLITSLANIGKLSADSGQAANLLKIVQNITQIEVSALGHKAGTFMLQNNGFFVQLIALCSNHPDPAVKELAQNLYDQYLALPELAQYAALLPRDHCCHGIRGTKTSEDQPMKPLDVFDPAYLFVTPKGSGGSYDGLILSKNDIHSMLRVDAIADWSNAGFVTASIQADGQQKIDYVLLGSINTANVYSQFQVFKTTYRIQSELDILTRLFALLNLKHTNSSGEVGLLTHDYTKIFSAALISRGSKTKLTTAAHQNTLHAIFGHFLTAPNQKIWSLQAPPTLTETHIEAVLNSFKSLNPDALDSTNARILFCLATVMARLSSSSYFGEEYDSPTAIRVYAAGLLKKAQELDPALCSTSNYRDYMRKLLGLEGAFTCTDILSSTMRQHARNPADFNQIFLAIKPTGWA